MDVRSLDVEETSELPRQDYNLTSHPLRWFSVLMNVVLTIHVGSFKSNSNRSVYGPVAENDALFFSIAIILLLQALGYVAVTVPRCRESARDVHFHCADSQPYVFLSLSDYLKDHPNCAMMYWVLAVTSFFFAFFNGVFLLVDRFTCSDEAPHRLLQHNDTSLPPLLHQPCLFQKGVQVEVLLSQLNDIAVMSSVWAWNGANVFELMIYFKYSGLNDCYNRYISTTLAVANCLRTLVVSQVAPQVFFPLFVLFRWLSMPLCLSVKLTCIKALNCKSDAIENTQDTQVEGVQPVMV